MAHNSHQGVTSRHDTEPDCGTGGSAECCPGHTCASPPCAVCMRSTTQDGCGRRVLWAHRGILECATAILQAGSGSHCVGPMGPTFTTCSADACVIVSHSWHAVLWATLVVARRSNESMA